VIIDMENEDADDVYQFTPSQSSQGERKHKKKLRGMTQMKELIIKRSVNKKEVVANNEWGQPTEDEEAKIEKDKGRCGIDRSELWSRGRVFKKGGHTEEIKAVVDRIEDYNQQFQEGNLEIDGSNDILTMSLGTP
ncbi:hypothetical protein PanWU01x14_344930, partial [Parasponia andersonii]